MPLGEYDQWSDEDFEEEDIEEEEEVDEDEPVIAKADQASDAAKYKSETPPKLPPTPAKPDPAPLSAAQLEARKHIWPYQWDPVIADKIRQGVLPPELGVSYLEFSWYRNRMHQSRPDGNQPLLPDVTPSASEASLVFQPAKKLPSSEREIHPVIAGNGTGAKSEGLAEVLLRHLGLPSEPCADNADELLRALDSGNKENTRTG